MGKKPLVVVGIDPGTTAGYAVLSIDGKLLSYGASKEFSVSDIISHVVQFGRVLGVGTDKKETPKSVNEFATKMGARVFSPKYDLSKQFKSLITQKYPTHNDHEMDALAAALFCHEKMKPILQGAEYFSKKHGCQPLQEDLAEVVIKNPELSFGAALKLLEEPAQAPIFKKVIELKNPDVEDYANLRNKIQGLKEDNKMLKQQNERLVSESKKKMKKPKIDPLKPSLRLQQLLTAQESKARMLLRELSVEKEEVRKREKQIALLTKFLSTPKTHIILKKLDNLGIQELRKKSYLNIQEGDMLYVRNPSIMSKAAYEELKEKVQKIVHREPVSQKLRQEMVFHFIHESKISLEHGHDFAMAKKSDMDRQIKSSEVLDRVLQEYKATQS